MRYKNSRRRAVKICKNSECDVSAHYLDGGTGRYCISHKHAMAARTIDKVKKPYHRKNRLIKAHGWKCWECNGTEWRGKPMPLQLDHIDGNKNNNGEMNLRILCANCHAQTDTFCGKNIGRYGALV